MFTNSNKNNNESINLTQQQEEEILNNIKADNLPAPQPKRIKSKSEFIKKHYDKIYELQEQGYTFEVIAEGLSKPFRDGQGTKSLEISAQTLRNYMYKIKVAKEKERRKEHAKRKGSTIQQNQDNQAQ